MKFETVVRLDRLNKVFFQWICEDTVSATARLTSLLIRFPNADVKTVFTPGGDRVMRYEVIEVSEEASHTGEAYK